MAKDNGWVNENLFLGASVQDYSVNPAIGKIIGIRLWTNNSNHTVNNNVFVKPCLQCLGAPVLFNYAWYNEFIGVRCESTGRPAGLAFYVLCIGSSKNNIFETLYPPETKIFDSALSAANNFGNAVFNRGTAPKRQCFSWVYDKSKVVKYYNALFVHGLDSYCMYTDDTSGQPEYAYGDFNDIGIAPSSSNFVGRYFNLTDCPNIMGCAHSDGDLRWVVLMFDENFAYINATDGVVNETNPTVNFSNMLIDTVNNKKYARSPDNTNDELVIFNVKNTNAKYAFVGVFGGNISRISFYNYFDESINLATTNIMPKRMVDIDGLKITNSAGLKVANIGQFVRDNSATITQGTDGSYMTIGYVRTGGTDDAQEFKAVKAKV